MKILAISGKAQNGKDVSGVILKQLLEEKGKKVLIFHYGDLVKYMCKSLFDWDGLKNEAGRSLLQKVGTEQVRKQKPNYWVDYLIELLEIFKDCWDYVIIPDCRFPNEIELLKKEGYAVTTIRIIRQNFISPLTEEQQNHMSETALDNYKMNIIVYNNSTLEELRNAYSRIVNDL